MLPQEINCGYPHTKIESLVESLYCSSFICRGGVTPYQVFRTHLSAAIGLEGGQNSVPNVLQSYKLARREIVVASVDCSCRQLKFSMFRI